VRAKKEEKDKMKKFSRFALGVLVAVGCGCVTGAQEKPAIPKVLQITREYLKPGRSGMAHEKSESAFVEAMRRAKWPTYYIGMTSLSGKSRALFLTSYDSFDAWQKDSDAVGKNGTLSTAIDKAYMTDGDLLDSLDQGVLYFNEEMSMNPRADLSQFRYMEFTLFHVKPGKDAEWREIVKMAKAGYQKGIPDAHWGMFEEVYGGDGGTYVLLSGHKSLAEIDKAFGDDKKFAEAMGEEGMKKFSELISSCLSNTQTQLFAFNAHMSYVKDEWIKADPEFWGAKAEPMKAAKEKKKE
jgi:hypothetical protein